MNKKTSMVSTALLVALALLVSLAGAADNPAAAMVMGRVTVIEGDQVTLQVGGMDGGQPPQMNEQSGVPPQISQPSDADTPGTPPGGQQQGIPPELSQGRGGTAPTQVVAIAAETSILIEENGAVVAATLADIVEGDMLQVTLGSEAATTVVIMRGQPPMGGGPGGPMPGSAPPSDGQAGSPVGSMALTAVYTVDNTTEAPTEGSLSAGEANQSVVLVTGGGSLSLTGTTLAKTGGGTSSDDESNFYGLNAALAVTTGSTAQLADVTITTAADGANAVFVTGEGAVVTVDGLAIQTTANSSRGLDATYGGTIVASNVNITTEGAHCAPIATDRGEGTITVQGGTVAASGDGSPNIYSTGNITAQQLTGVATGSQAAVVEGKNSITLVECDLVGAGLNGVMLYQSTSGDASVGTAQFTAADSRLATTSTGPMFYVTNTQAQATLTNTELTFTSGVLAEVAGNSTNNWGAPDSNGGQFTLTGIRQTLTGNIVCDGISTVNVQLSEGSVLTGAVNANQAAQRADLALDAASSWTLTADSYLTAFANEQADCANIQSAGFNIYYDANDTANAWLAGETIALPGGGQLTPAA